MAFELAQVNIAVPVAPPEDPQLADFMAGLDPVNALADASPGFVWRLQTEDGNATAIRVFEDEHHGGPGVLINMSVWTDVEALANFVFSQEHRKFMVRRKEWFQRMREAYVALWWVPAGHRPDPAEAEDRIRHLRANGPTPYAFTIKRHFPRPDVADSPAEAREGQPDWYCPA